MAALPDPSARLASKACKAELACREIEANQVCPDRRASLENVARRETLGPRQDLLDYLERKAVLVNRYEIRC